MKGGKVDEMGKIKNHNDFCEFVESQNYKLLSPYIKSNIKVSLQCPENHIFEMKPANFKFGQRCPECYKLNKRLNCRLTYEHVKSFIEDAGYKLLSKTYETAHEKLLVRCPEGHEYEVQYANFYSGKRCPECYIKSKSKELSHSYKYINDYFDEFGYKLLSKEYKNNKKLLLVQCPEGHLWKVRFDNFYSGQRCPNCIETKGEQKISNYLVSSNIKYIPQHKYNDCRYKNPLAFDFYLLDYNTCIEYQGEQHYFPVDFAGKGEKWAEKQFKLNQKRDQIKREYCNKNNIKLIEIPYWEFNDIDKILDKELKLNNYKEGVV